MMIRCCREKICVYEMSYLRGMVHNRPLHKANYLQRLPEQEKGTEMISYLIVVVICLVLAIAFILMRKKVNKVIKGQNEKSK